MAWVRRSTADRGLETMQVEVIAVNGEGRVGRGRHGRSSRADAVGGSGAVAARQSPAWVEHNGGRVAQAGEGPASSSG